MQNISVSSSLRPPEVSRGWPSFSTGSAVGNSVSCVSVTLWTGLICSHYSVFPAYCTEPQHFHPFTHTPASSAAFWHQYNPSVWPFKPFIVCIFPPVQLRCQITFHSLTVKRSALKSKWKHWQVTAAAQRRQKSNEHPSISVKCSIRQLTSQKPLQTCAADEMSIPSVALGWKQRTQVRAIQHMGITL